MNPAKVDHFMAVYVSALKSVVTSYSDEYHWPPESLPAVIARVRVAIEKGTYNHRGQAFKATCGQLGIRHTRNAIERFLEQ